MASVTSTPKFPQTSRSRPALPKPEVCNPPCGPATPEPVICTSPESVVTDADITCPALSGQPWLPPKLLVLCFPIVCSCFSVCHGLCIFSSLPCLPLCCCPSLFVSVLFPVLLWQSLSRAPECDDFGHTCDLISNT